MTGVSVADGGSGDPSPPTAVGVVAGIRAALPRCTAIRSPAGRKVAVQGTGHVGANVVRLLVEAGAKVDGRRPAARTGRPRWRPSWAPTVAGVDEILFARVRRAVAVRAGRRASRPTPIPRLRCRAIAGAANNQLGTIDERRRAGRPRHRLRGRLRGQRRRHHQHRRASSAATTPSGSARARAASSRPSAGCSRWPASAASRPPAPPRRWPASASPRSPRSPAAGGPATARPGRRAAAWNGSAARDPAAGQRPDAAPATHDVADHRRSTSRCSSSRSRSPTAPCAATTATARCRSRASTRPRWSTASRRARSESECDRPGYGETLRGRLRRRRRRGQRARQPGSRVADPAVGDVHARRLDPPDRQHAVPVRLRQQRRGRDGPRRVPAVLPARRPRGIADAVRHRHELRGAEHRRQRRDRRRARRLRPAAPARPRADGHPAARVRLRGGAAGACSCC